MRGAELATIRAAMRDREGELREVALERLRHVMRRTAARLERERREGLRCAA